MFLAFFDNLSVDVLINFVLIKKKECRWTTRNDDSGPLLTVKDKNNKRWDQRKSELKKNRELKTKEVKELKSIWNMKENNISYEDEDA